MLVDESFREMCDDPVALAQKVSTERDGLASLRQIAEREGTVKAVADVGRMANRCCEHLITLGSFQSDEKERAIYLEALELTQEAIEIWKQLERAKAGFLGRLRRARINSHLGAFCAPSDPHDQRTGAAEAKFDTLLRHSLEGPGAIYRDFVLEALALHYARHRRFDEAAGAMREAREIRRERGSDKHIRQTDQLLDQILNAGREEGA